MYTPIGDIYWRLLNPQKEVFMYYVRMKKMNAYLAQRPHSRTLSLYLGDFINAVHFDSIEHAKIIFDFYQQVLGKKYEYEVVKIIEEVSL